MRDQLSDNETEIYEHIPWSRLTLTNGTGARGRWMYFAAALLIAAALAAVVARMVWQPGAAVAAPSTSSLRPIAEIPEPVPPPVLYSEADLMAASPPLDIGRKVASVAERYVRRWAGGSDDSWSYVEWIIVDSVEDLGDGRFTATVLMQLLVAGETGTVRLPVEGLVITVLVDGDVVSVVDLPSPVGVGALSVGRPVAGNAEIPAAVARGALDAVAPWGTATVVGGGPVDDRWRVEVEVESSGGLLRTVAVWMSPEGLPVALVP
ncbi:MAG TPA: hypothetical protein VLT15_09715 [Acidimicrobiia bacterium]|nr:hypothetical protein [Acidimicrobiia bacterium]